MFCETGRFCISLTPGEAYTKAIYCSKDINQQLLIFTLGKRLNCELKRLHCLSLIDKYCNTQYIPLVQKPTKILQKWSSYSKKIYFSDGRLAL